MTSRMRTRDIDGRAFLVATCATVAGCTSMQGARAPWPIVMLHLRAAHGVATTASTDRATWSGEAWITTSFAPALPSPPKASREPVDTEIRLGRLPAARDTRLIAWEEAEVARALGLYARGEPE